jgi:transcriptional regulator with XRE-family HTH domain
MTDVSHGAILRRLREDAGLSMAALGERAGVPKPSVQVYEGGASPNIAAARRIARVLGVNVADIWGDGGDASAEDVAPGADVDVRVALRLARALNTTVETLFGHVADDLAAANATPAPADVAEAPGAAA